MYLIYETNIYWVPSPLPGNMAEDKTNTQLWCSQRFSGELHLKLLGLGLTQTICRHDGYLHIGCQWVLPLSSKYRTKKYFEGSFGLILLPFSLLIRQQSLSSCFPHAQTSASPRNTEVNGMWCSPQGWRSGRRRTGRYPSVCQGLWGALAGSTSEWGLGTECWKMKGILYKAGVVWLGRWRRCSRQRGPRQRLGGDRVLAVLGTV